MLAEKRGNCGLKGKGKSEETGGSRGLSIEGGQQTAARTGPELTPASGPGVDQGGGLRTHVPSCPRQSLTYFDSARVCRRRADESRPRRYPLLPGAIEMRGIARNLCPPFEGPDWLSLGEREVPESARALDSQ
jgi:hypothetical protein